MKTSKQIRLFSDAELEREFGPIPYLKIKKNRKLKSMKNGKKNVPNSKKS